MGDEPTTALEQEIAGQGGFVHHYAHSLDPKRRLTIPSQWRAQIGSPRGLYVLPSMNDDRCLICVPVRDMKPRIDKMRQQAIADGKARQFARALASQSDLVSWDSQGRIRVKDELLEFAGIVDAVALQGAWDTFELWNPAILDATGSLSREIIREAGKLIGF